MKQTAVQGESAIVGRVGDIPLYSEEGFEGMRQAGRLSALALDMLVKEVKPGVTTMALDRLAFEFARDHAAIPANVGYRGFQHTLCTSINHVVCHGIPGERILREGDILNIDITLILDGWYGDTSRMYAVGGLALI